jgi:hypothetical protein
MVVQAACAAFHSRHLPSALFALTRRLRFAPTHVSNRGGFNMETIRTGCAVRCDAICISVVLPDRCGCLSGHRELTPRDATTCSTRNAGLSRVSRALPTSGGSQGTPVLISRITPCAAHRPRVPGSSPPPFSAPHFRSSEPCAVSMNTRRQTYNVAPACTAAVV